MGNAPSHKPHQPPVRVLPALPPMAQRLQDWRKGAPLSFAAMDQVHVQMAGDLRLTFHVNMTQDPIQDAHRKGRFYEAEDLAVLMALLPKAAVVLDVGANVGNHALFFATVAGAAKVVVIEPNPLALEPLVANVLCNKLDAIISLDHLGFGLSDRNESGYFMKVHDRNLGATRMEPRLDGRLSVRRGDDEFPNLRPDLIKIDVEGMEMDVLAGLEGMIARARPVLMVEVGAENQIEFALWAAVRGYMTHAVRAVGPKNDNHILVPLSAAEMAE